jgi:quinol monooxygenase YgiN
MNGLRCALFVAAAVALSIPQARAQTPPGSPAMVVTYLEVVPSAEAEAMRLLKEVAAASREEAGNLRFEVLQRIERPAHFAIIEAWADSKAFESHGANGATKTFRDKLKPLQVGPYDERPNVAVSLGAVEATGSKGAIYVLSHVDVPGVYKDETSPRLQKLAEDGRKTAERFEVWYQGNRTNHFTVSEIWKSEAAHQNYLTAAGTREFREWIGPKLGALYDDRRYKNLE